MKYFTSDLHLGDDRLGVNGKPNVFYRPFKNITEQNYKILNNLNDVITKNDELYIIGDLLYDVNYKSLLTKLPKCKKYLIAGNYDVDILDILRPYFEEINYSKTIMIDNHKVILHHYPADTISLVNSFDCDFGIVGHIHGAWKFQPQLINVSTDAWHFKPVSELEILFGYNAIKNHYDENVFLNNINWSYDINLIPEYCSVLVFIGSIGGVLMCKHYDGEFIIAGTKNKLKEDIVKYAVIR